MEYVIGLLVAVLGMLFYERTKKQSAEGLLQNLENKEKDVELQTDQAKNSGLLSAEEEKQRQIKEEVKAKLNETGSVNTILDSFNRRK